MTSPSSRLAERMKRGDVFDRECRSRRVLGHVTSTWGVIALIALQPGTLRFGELRRKMNGTSERMLAKTLQQLEGDGLVHRQSFPVVPPHVEYTLTPLGRDAARHVEALVDWIEDTLPSMPASPARAGTAA